MTGALGPDPHFSRNPAVLWRSTSVGPVLLTPEADQPMRLLGADAVVWELLDAPMTLPELTAGAAALLDRTLDLTEPLARLEDHGLLERS